MKQRLHRALRWSEKYTKTDLAYISKGGFWLTAAKISSMFASLASSIAFANLLPEETYGMFRYVLSVMVLLTIPTLDGIDTALTRSIAKGEKSSYHGLLITKMKWAAIGMLASLAIAAYYFVNGNNILYLSFLIASIFIPIMDPLHLYAGILNGKKKFDILAREEVATRMLVTVLLIVVIFYTQNILFILSVFLVTTTLFRLHFLLPHLKKSSGSDDFSNKEILRYGKHLTAINMLGKVSTQLDKILLFQQFGGAVLAGFYLALMPFKQAQNMFNTLGTLALPKFSNNTPAELKKTLPLKLFKLYGLLLPAVVVYILIAPFIFSLLFPLYMEYVFISQLLMLQLLFFPRILLHNALLAQDQKKKLYLTSGSYAIIRIVFTLTLIPLYGITGAAAAILVVTIVHTILTLITFLRM